MKKITFVLLTGILFAISISCKKEVPAGCTDPIADNFDPDAEKYDGSCVYSGEAVIWYDQVVASNLVNDGAQALRFYVDGSLYGSQAAAVYYVSEPHCGYPGSITISKDLGSSKNKSYNVRIMDQTNWIYWDFNINIEANECNSIKLGW
jgi:hypothetical protein